MREIGNAVLHVVGGCLIALAIMWIYWLAIPALFVVGFLRERAQHRYDHEVRTKIKDGVEKLYVHKTSVGVFGWITKRRMLEALHWPLGALVACITWLIIK